MKRLLNWISDPNAIRPYARRALTATGAGQGVLALIGWAIFGSPARYGMYKSLFGTTVLKVILAVLAFGLVAYVLRTRETHAGRWWSSSPALLVTCAVYGAGTGMLYALLLQGQMGLGMLQGFFMGVLGTVVVSVVERGRLPVAGVALSVVCGALVSFERICAGGLVSRWRIDDVVVFAVMALFVFPFGYLVVRGLLVLVAGRSDGESAGLFAGPPPLEVRRLEGGYLILVEAPGLGSADGLTVTVRGFRVEVHAPEQVLPSDGLLFSTRAAGPLQASLVLPRSVGQPTSVGVEAGLITLRVPLAEQAEASTTVPEDEPRS